MSKTKKPEKTRRGFACVSPERMKEIAKSGGKAAHAKGAAHTFTSEQAREAGKRGGKMVARSLGRGHMAEIGRRGGKSTQGEAQRQAKKRERELHEAQQQEQTGGVAGVREESTAAAPASALAPAGDDANGARALPDGSPVPAPGPSSQPSPGRDSEAA